MDPGTGVEADPGYDFFAGLFGGVVGHGVRCGGFGRGAGGEVFLGGWGVGVVRGGGFGDAT